MSSSIHFPVNDPNFYAGDPYPTYKRLRENDPVHWNTDEEIWCLTKLGDVQDVSKDPSRFRSGDGVLLNDKYREVAPGESILSTDPPDHRQLRKLVHRAFSRKRIAAMEGRIRSLVVELLAPVEAGQEVDFVEAVSLPLPILVIAELMGIPSEDRERFAVWSDAVIGAAEGQTPEIMGKVIELLGYLREIVEQRRKQPGDDLVSVVLETRVNGERLSEPELLVFCMALLVAGNETTRTLLSNGMHALAENPDQVALLVGDQSLVAQAVEEMLRYDAPIQSFTRTTSESVTIRGQVIEAGQRVLLLYGAANRDADEFGVTSEEFRISRKPGQHVAFGWGEHYCLGASLARLEGEVALQEIFRRFGEVQSAGPIERQPGTLVRGVKKLPLVFS
ncbi:MAG: cytochrome P450 [Deltaproteobacteria bacterium]|nr:cytochrome P450 [Deltaproteobacteria bacterium]